MKRSRLAIFSVLCFTSLAFGTEAPITGTIQLADHDNKSCQLVASGEGTTYVIRDCDLSPHFLRVLRVPSTTTITLTARDCSESTESQGWWVRIRATARETSSSRAEGTNVANIVMAAQQYLANPDKSVFIDANLRIEAAGIKSGVTPSAQARCAVVRLPTTPPGDPSRVRVEILPERSGDTNIQVGCGEDLLFMNYFAPNNDGGNSHRYRYIQQCVRLTDTAGHRIIAANSEEMAFTDNMPAVQCHGNKLVTAMRWHEFGAVFLMECADLYNTHTKKYLKTSNKYAGRVITSKDSILLCEVPNTSAPAQLVWKDSVAMTGWDTTSSTHQAWCSTYTQ